jgi:type VI secretion system protein ImpA
MESVLNYEQLLQPISESNPVGKDLRYEEEYFELETARQADDDTSSQGEWARERKSTDWNQVIRLGQELLIEKSKDLQIAAWLTEALAQVHGLSGMRDGLNLLRELEDRYWDKAHPAEGDLELRQGVYEFLDEERILPLLVRTTPTTHVNGAPELSYSFLRYKESRDTENLARKLTKDDDPEEKLGGRLRAAEFDKAVELTERQFYVDLLSDLGECQAALGLLNDDIKKRWTLKTPSPTLTHLPVAIRDVEKLAKQFFDRKPAPAAEPQQDESEDEEAGGEPASETLEESWSAAEDQEVASVAERPKKRKLVSVEDPREQIALSAYSLRQADRTDPTPYLVLRALVMGRLFQAEPLSSAIFPSPSSRLRERLHELEGSEEGDHWTSLLEESEQALGQPEGAGWLDLQRYSLMAMAAEGHVSLESACRAILSACLREKADWPSMLLKDGTPCASEATRAWIRSEKLGSDDNRDGHLLRATEPATASSAGTTEAGEEPSVASSEPDPWTQALLLRQAGKTSEAISVLARAARQARTGRERFIRTLEQAEICLAENRVELALPLLDGLAQRVDEFHLDQWEDSSLCARIFSTLYRCLRGKDEVRARAVYNRLCQLDLTVALALEGP